MRSGVDNPTVQFPGLGPPPPYGRIQPRPYVITTQKTMRLPRIHPPPRGIEITMTTYTDIASTNTDIAGQSGVSGVLFGYTPERYEALALTGRGRIVVAIDGMLRHRDSGIVLDPGVFAALLTLRDHGYLDAHLPPPGTPPAVWPVRLTLSGTALLDGFRHEHARQTAPPPATPAT